MNDHIEQALMHEREGNIEASARFYEQALEQSPNDKDVLYFTGAFLFRTGNYEEALDIFVRCYSHELQTESIKEEILNHIISAYYEPNKDFLKDIYQNNIKNLRTYEHNYLKPFLSFDEIPFICVPKNDYIYYIFDKNTKQFEEIIEISNDIRLECSLKRHECVIIADVFDLKKLQLIHEQTYEKMPDNIKIPVYLVWSDNEMMYKYLHITDYEPVIGLGRFVFFSNDKSSIGLFFKDHQSIPPQKYYDQGNILNEVRAIINKAIDFRNWDQKQKMELIKDIADKYDKDYYEKLFSGSYDKYRILFITTRFSTVIQYSTRDCISGCEALGIQCDLVIEKSDIHRVFVGELLNKIIRFRPNIIFQIDHFKWEYEFLPEKYMFITWVQDPMEHIFSREAAKKLSWNEFVLAMTGVFKSELHDLGYPDLKVLHQTIPVNPKLFYKREISTTEREHFAADIVSVTHTSDPETRLRNLIEIYAGNLELRKKQRLRAILNLAYEITYERINNSENIFTNNDYRMILEKAAHHYGEKINIPDSFVYKFGLEVGNSLHRLLPMIWLAEKGFSIKLWGQEWDRNEKLAKYSMGVAAHGEELAKIYTCAKITIGTQPYVTLHFRAFESMACGSLFLCKKLPTDHDQDNILEYFIENEDFVFFYSKDDLLNKVDYFLKNDSERRRIAENGRKKVLKNFTYKKAMENWISFVKTSIN
ncbi:MAG: glycosyltransferase family protein [Bacillota bacterium]